MPLHSLTIKGDYEKSCATRLCCYSPYNGSPAPADSPLWRAKKLFRGIDDDDDDIIQLMRSG